MAIFAVGFAVSAAADPILTFADPGTQCFQFVADSDPNADKGWLIGGNADIVVDVLAGAYAGTTFDDASFTMTDTLGGALDVTWDDGYPYELELEGGKIEIWDDDGAQLLLGITFDYAILYPGNVGAADTMTACDVTFSGLVTQGLQNLDAEQFSFAFASMHPEDPFGYDDIPDWTATASFASGADFSAVPEPGTLTMAISGTLAFMVTVARRKLR